MKSYKKKRIVITGIGPIASVGTGKNDFWQGLVSRKTGLRLENLVSEGESWGKFHLHKIKDFDINNFGIEKRYLQDIKTWKENKEIPDLYLLIAAVKLALDDSRLKYPKDNNNIGLVITHENPGLEPYFNQIIDIAEGIFKDKKISTKKQIFEELYPAMMKSSYELQTFMPVFHIAKTFGIHGFSLFINNACASGLYGIETASQIIKSGKCPAIVVASSDYPGIYKYLWFKQLDMYAQDGLIKPFSKDANGFVMGECGIGLLLEDLDYARERKAHIYAEYLGGGFSLESWKVTIPAVGNNFLGFSIQEALKKSQVKKEEVDLICVHGVGNTVIDRYEARAITKIFGDYPKKPLITAFKSYIGHTLGASSLLETAISVLCMEKNTVIPALNYKESAPGINIKLIKEKLSKKINIVLKTCSAFAGFTAAAVFKKLK